MTMSEGALTRYFDLPPGKWRINSSVPGFKVVAVALVDLRHRLFPLRQVEASEFAKHRYAAIAGIPSNRSAAKSLSSCIAYFSLYNPNLPLACSLLQCHCRARVLQNND